MAVIARQTAFAPKWCEDFMDKRFEEKGFGVSTLEIFGYGRRGLLAMLGLDEGR